jgi:hypothetical protein
MKKLDWPRVALFAIAFVVAGALVYEGKAPWTVLGGLANAAATELSTPAAAPSETP